MLKSDISIERDNATLYFSPRFYIYPTTYIQWHGIPCLAYLTQRLINHTQSLICALTTEYAVVNKFENKNRPYYISVTW